jgi:hypothetical protein
VAKSTDNNNYLDKLKLKNFRRKEGIRMNISLVNQSLMLAKQINHLELRNQSSWIEKQIKVNKERDISSKRSRSSSVKKQE